jgi:hypothetical protein
MNGSASGEHFRASSHVDEQGRPRDAPKLETLDALALIAGKTHQKQGNRLHAAVGVNATLTRHRFRS